MDGYRVSEKINGTKPLHNYHRDELDFLRGLSKEELEKLWKSVMPNYVPYIVPLGDGLFQVNGGGKFSYITGKQGVIEADKALRKAAEEYGKI